MEVVENSQKIDVSKIRPDDLRGLARAVLTSAAAAMQSEEIMRDFEKWKAARNFANQ